MRRWRMKSRCVSAGEEGREDSLLFNTNTAVHCGQDEMRFIKHA